MKRNRPTIPETTKCELWAKAAGRCEFRGCNKLLFRDELTKKRSNLSAISHIVAFSDDGPRGDPIRSRLLEKDIDNLMLTCKEHGKLIDDKARETEYPESLLLEFKQEHERRIRMLTNVQEEAQTHVVLVQASIDARDLQIDQAAAFRAILPKYPAEETARVINLSDIAISAEQDGFFSVLATAITGDVRDLLRHRRGREIRSMSVFALAPIPLLVHLGVSLGDLDHVDLFQRHRGSQDWGWEEDEEPSDFFETRVHHRSDDAAIASDDAAIAVALSVSDAVSSELIAAAVGGGVAIYEIRAKEPHLDFLRSRTRLELFGYEARRLLQDLRASFGRDRVIHLFAAVPAPVAIEFGRSLKPFDSPFLVYEYSKTKREYVPALTVDAGREETP